MKDGQIMNSFFFLYRKRKIKMLGGRNEGMYTILGFNQIQFKEFYRFID